MHKNGHGITALLCIPRTSSLRSACDVGAGGKILQRRMRLRWLGDTTEAIAPEAIMKSLTLSSQIAEFALKVNKNGCNGYRLL